MRRVAWHATSVNAKSVQTGKRMGFQQEGILRWYRVLPPEDAEGRQWQAVTRRRPERIIGWQRYGCLERVLGRLGGRSEKAGGGSNGTKGMTVSQNHIAKRMCVERQQ